MRVAALSTAAGGAHRVVVEEELRGTSGQRLTLVHYSAQRKHILWDTLGA
jgi:hypothetical protein